MTTLQGQRTGVKTRYANFGTGWQHWFSPHTEIRPEVVYYHSLDANAFNGNSNRVRHPQTARRRRSLRTKILPGSRRWT
jgi:hypothetical protein